MKYRPFQRLRESSKWHPVGYWKPYDEAFEIASAYAKENPQRTVALRGQDGSTVCEWRLKP